MDNLLAIIDLIETHLSDNLSVDAIAQRSGYNRHYLHRQFKHATGLSIGQYQRCRQLSLAAKQLGESDQRILDIAVEAGFESQEAFARAFKRFASVAPKNVRQHPIWAARLRFPRLDATLLHQLAILRDTPFSIGSVPARRWACYALRQDNLHRSAHLGEDVQQGIAAFLQQPLAAPFRALPSVIIELREHHQYATSTFPLALAFAVEPDTPIPPAMFEIHQPERTELRLTMPCADFIPALLYHLPVRLGTMANIQLTASPTLWFYSDDNLQFHACFGIDDTPQTRDTPAPRERLELPLTTLPATWQSLPLSKWAGTRRLATLWQDFAANLHALQQQELASRWIAFGDPGDDPNQQYQVAFSAHAQEEISTQSGLTVGGTYLRTTWQGNDIFALENAIEDFYWALQQDPQYYYSPRPEVIRNLTIEDDQIAFELLTPVKSRRGR